MHESLQARRMFARADEVELARALLEDVATGSSDGAPLVADRGALYAYSTTTGIWTELPHERLAAFIAGYAGARISNRKGSSGIVHIGHGTIRNTIKCALDLAHRPNFFDGAMRGIAFEDGYVAVDDDGTIRPIAHNPETRALAGLPFPYQPKAAAPRFQRFLDDIFRGDEDRKAKQDLLAEFYGACFVGVATRFQKALLLQGDGENGKGTLINILSALFPPNTIVAIAPQHMDQEYRRARLAHARINAVSELPEADILHSESFKAIIAGDLITGRHIYGRPFHFRPVAGHVFSGNALPAVSDQTHAFWRRFLVVPFRRIFTDVDRELDLDGKIIRAELPGVAAWILAGAARLLRRAHYIEPASATAAKREWQEASDQVLQYLNARTVPSIEPETGAMKLYKDYAYWARFNGHSVMSSTKFFARLRGAGHAPHRDAEQRLYRLIPVTAPTRSELS